MWQRITKEDLAKAFSIEQLPPALAALVHREQYIAAREADAAKSAAAGAAGAAAPLPASGADGEGDQAQQRGQAEAPLPSANEQTIKTEP